MFRLKFFPIMSFFQKILQMNGVQVINQVIGVAIIIGYDVVVSLVILKAVDLVIGLRASEEAEREGLDQQLHGETVH